MRGRSSCASSPGQGPAACPRVTSPTRRAPPPLQTARCPAADRSAKGKGSEKCNKARVPASARPHPGQTLSTMPPTVLSVSGLGTRPRGRVIAKAKRRTAHPSPSLDDRLPSPPSPFSPPSSSASPPPAAAAASSSAEAASSSAARGAAPLSSSSPPSLIAPCRPSTRDPRPSMSSPPPNLTLMPVACTRSRDRGL